MTPTRLMPLLLLLASAALVGGALLFQYLGGLQPCELCLYQRWPYYATLVIALIAVAAGRRDLTRSVLALCALMFLGGAVLAFYHVGVEQHWFAGPTACTGAVAAGGSLADFKAQLLARQPVSCDEPQWSLFGVSLAGWNLLASLALVAFCLWALRRLLLSRRTA